MSEAEEASDLSALRDVLRRQAAMSRRYGYIDWDRLEEDEGDGLIIVGREQWTLEAFSEAFKTIDTAGITDANPTIAPLTPDLRAYWLERGVMQTELDERALGLKSLRDFDIELGGDGADIDAFPKIE